MTATQSIEVQLPADAPVEPADRELLRATLQALVSLRCERGRAWDEVRRRLEGEGWRVDWNLNWRVRARRGEESEEAAGKTLDEAFAELEQLVRLDMVGHAP